MFAQNCCCTAHSKADLTCQLCKAHLAVDMGLLMEQQVVDRYEGVIVGFEEVYLCREEECHR